MINNLEFNLLSALLIGLAGSVHCISMCGGIVGSFSFLLPKERSHLPYLFSYNAGRILSYSLAGLVAGALGAGVIQNLANGLVVLKIFSALLLFLLACYIANWWRVLTKLESLGKHVWQHLHPLSKRFLPLNHPIKALPYGFIWGWLPCGLVYSTLSWSVASGSALDGALVMLFFGLGTLPAMLSFGASAEKIKPFLRKKAVKNTIAVVLTAYAFVLIYPLIRS